MPIISDKKTIFIRVPKTASSSMYNVIGPGEGPMHESARDIKARIGSDVFYDYFKFGFVRNPWDWLLSWMSYKQNKRPGKYVGFDFNKWVESIGRVMDSRGGIYWSKGVDFELVSDSVPCTLKSCRANDGYSCICMVRQSQSSLLCDDYSSPIVDFIGRFENIREDWKEVCFNIGLNKVEALPFKNKSTHSHYRDVYSDVSAEIIFNIFRKDIEMFNYKF